MADVQAGHALSSLPEVIRKGVIVRLSLSWFNRPVRFFRAAAQSLCLQRPPFSRYSHATPGMITAHLKKSLSHLDPQPFIRKAISGS